MENRPWIYIIEDVPEISSLISMYLTKAEMNTKVFATAEEALEELKVAALPDLFILDLNLPGMSGFDFLKQINEEYHERLPVIIVSARDADEDIIKALGYGADEFVTKPFSPKVLVARVQAYLRRLAVASAQAEEVIKFGEYILLLNSNVLKRGTVKIPLSVKEYAVLEFLLKNAGSTLTPEKIYQGVWKSNFGDVTAVAVYIQRLRKKIEPDPANPIYIKTDFGNGYEFDKDRLIS